MPGQKLTASSSLATQPIQHKLVVEYWDPARIRPDANNPRTHSKKQLSLIAASMREHGNVNPILVDEAGIIIAGHGRLLGVKHLGLSEAPVIVLRGLSEAQKIALSLADNKLALHAGWDPELLRVKIDSLLQFDASFDLAVTGFSTGEIDVMLSEGKPVDPDDNVVPATPAWPVSRLGDIWGAGPHRVCCGDSRDRQVL